MAITVVSRLLRVVCVALSFVCASGEARAAEPDATLKTLTRPGHVLILRHALAPGVGDPTTVVIGDCGTQRNLDERGRAQAKAWGERLRTVGVSRARVLTSQWCRCRDTARLLAVGRAEDLTALNSFFDEPAQREPRVTALRAFLDGLPRDGGPVVLVTHQVTITALTGLVPASAAGAILSLRAGGGFDLVHEVGMPD